MFEQAVVDAIADHEPERMPKLMRRAPLEPIPPFHPYPDGTEHVLAVGNATVPHARLDPNASRMSVRCAYRLGSAGRSSLQFFAGLKALVYRPTHPAAFVAPYEGGLS